LKAKSVRPGTDTLTPLRAGVEASRQVGDGAIQARVNPVRCELCCREQGEVALGEARMWQHQCRALDHEPGREQEVDVERPGCEPRLKGPVATGGSFQPLGTGKQAERVAVGLDEQRGVDVPGLRWSERGGPPEVRPAGDAARARQTGGGCQEG